MNFRITPCIQKLKSSWNVTFSKIPYDEISMKITENPLADIILAKKKRCVLQ
jgi:hypothetical protein